VPCSRAREVAADGLSGIMWPLDNSVGALTHRAL
jgi:hypothetical protein